MATVSPQFYDRVYQRSTATGNGATFLLGDAVKGYLTFKDAIGLNVNFEYVIEAIDRLGVPTGVFEVGLGKITQSGNNYYLNRTTVYKTSDLQNPTARINFGTGDKNVWCDVPAKRFNEYQDTLNSAVSSAATSASNAATSESNALSYRNAANTANTNAQSAKTAAQTAQTNAETAKTAAQSAQTAAETAKNQAVSAKTDAVNAKNAAVTAKGEAQTSATNAAESEANAQTYMQQASGFASNANTAKTAAQTAQTNAETANTNAQSAKTAAQNAQSAAESAQSAAESANSSAQSAKTSAQQSANRAEEIRQAIMTAGGASAIAGTGIEIGELDESNMTYTVNVKNEYLKLTGGTMTGSVTFSTGSVGVESGAIRGTANFNSNLECSPFEIVKSPNDNFHTGGYAQWHISRNANTKDVMMGLRVRNPRADSNDKPSSATISGETLNANTGNCWDKIGLYYHYELNRAYPYSATTPPLKGGSTKFYRGDHLVTHANLENFLTRNGNTNYPLTSAIYSATNDVIKRNVDNAHTTIFGGTSYSAGGSVMLIGKSQETNAGGFQLRATLDGSATKNLVGLPNGLLRWDGLANGINSALRLTGSAASYAIQIQTNAITKGTKPTSTVNNSLEFYGKTLSKYQNRLGDLSNTVDTSNQNRVYIRAYGLSSAEDTVSSQVEAWWRPKSDFVNGYERFAQCASPELVTYVDEKIATTRWVREAITRHHIGVAKGSVPTGNAYFEKNLADNYGISTNTSFGTKISDYTPAHRFGGIGTSLLRVDSTHTRTDTFLRSFWNIAGDTGYVGLTVRTQTAHNSSTGAGETKQTHYLLFDNCNYVYKNVDNGFTYFCAGTDTTKGAHLCLCGKDHNNKGKFWLRAQDANGYTSFEGRTDIVTKPLLWDGYNIITEGKINDIAKGTNPTDTKWCWSIKNLDNTGKETKNRLHEIRAYVDKNGKSGIDIMAYNFKANDTTSAVLSIIKEKDGASYAQVPTPATSDNSVKAANTSWVRTYGASTFLPLSGGTLSGALTINNALTVKEGYNVTIRGPLILKEATDVYNVNPTSDLHRAFLHQDKNGVNTGKLQFSHYQNGNHQIHLVVFSPTDKSENVAFRGVATADGKKYAQIDCGLNTLKLWDGVHSVIAMQAIDDGDGDTNYGSQLLIGCNGATYIGGGESHTNLYNAIDDKAENLHLAADGSVNIWANCQTIGNKHRWIFNGDGSQMLRMNGVVRGEKPSANKNGWTALYDVDGNVIVRTNAQYNTAQRHGWYVEPCNDAGTFNGYLGIFMDAQGTKAYTYAPTPDAGNNSNQIATTAFVQNALMGGVPVGTVVHYQGTTPPANWLRCNGAKNLSRTTYAKLYAVLGTTYGSNDANTFGVPDYRNRTAWGGASDTDRGYLSAGLPDITGKLQSNYFGRGINSKSGCFADSYLNNVGTKDSVDSGVGIDFKASNSNSIYGASTTVQPPAVKGMFIIKYQ